LAFDLCELIGEPFYLLPVCKILLFIAVLKVKRVDFVNDIPRLCGIMVLTGNAYCVRIEIQRFGCQIFAEVMKLVLLTVNREVVTLFVAGPEVFVTFDRKLKTCKGKRIAVTRIDGGFVR